MSKSGGGLGTRVVTALVLVSVALTLVWVPVLRPGFALFVALIAVAGQREFYAMAAAKEWHSKSHIAMALGIPVVLSGYFADFLWVNALLVAAFILVAFAHVLKPPVTMADIVSSIFGLVYVAWLPAHVLLLHSQPEVGAGLVMLLIVAVALTDVGAYFTGKSIGRHKLAPIVSPNKTWEGAVGGFCVTLIGTAVLYLLRNEQDWTALPDWSLVRYLIVGAVLSVASQVGDLTESALKRDAGIKDSGSLFPGHGGALDRCDGYLFAAPALYYITLM